jgi:hypothetical protein
MLNAFLVLCVPQAAECVDAGLEQVAWTRLEARGAVSVYRNAEGKLVTGKVNGHVTEAHLHQPWLKWTDDDLDDVARLQWARKVVVGGETTPHGLLKLFPMKRLRDLWACGEQYTHESVRPFWLNRRDVMVTPGRTDPKDFGTVLMVATALSSVPQWACLLPLSSSLRGAW